MTQQTHPGFATSAATECAVHRPAPAPDAVAHTQFLPADRATQMLLQQFL